MFATFLSIVVQRSDSLCDDAWDGIGLFFDLVEEIYYSRLYIPYCLWEYYQSIDGQSKDI